MFFTDENTFFHDSLRQGFINNKILGNNTCNAFCPVRTPFIVSIHRTLKIALAELEQPKIEQLARTIAI